MSGASSQAADFPARRMDAGTEAGADSTSDDVRRDGGGDGSGHVAVVDGSVRVADWRTRTPEVVRYFEEQLAEDRDLAASLDVALRIGVLALQNTGVSVNVDYVDKEFQRLTTRMEATLQSRLGHVEDVFDHVEDVFEDAFAAEDGRLAQALRTYLGEGGRLADMFDPNRRDSAVGRMRELLDEHFDGEGSRLHRLLDMTNDRSPIAAWRSEIEDGFHGIRRLLEEYRRELAEQTAAADAADAARAEEREKGTQKGRDYEELVFDALAGIAAVFGDTAEATGDVATPGGAKVGDVVVTLNARDTRGAEVRLVFEAKDKAVGLTPMLRELDAARENRGAAAAVAVYAREEHMPAGVAPFREQGSGRYLCLHAKDAGDDLCLQAAYRIARFWAIAELATDDGEIDARGIRDDLEAARHVLGNVAAIKGRLTKMRNAVDDAASGIEQQLESLRCDLVQTLDQIDARIRIDG